MKEVIDEVKGKNGNCVFTQKDMTWYLIGKIDKVYDTVDKIYDKLDKKVDKRTFFTVLTLMLALLVASKFF